MTNTADPRKYQYFPKFDWPRVDEPEAALPGGRGRDSSASQQVERAGARARSRRRSASASDDIAAIIIEPIQAEGGDNHFRPEFLRALRELARRERRAAHLRRGADRRRPHRQACGRTSTSASSPTCSRSARRCRCAACMAGGRDRRGARQRLQRVEPHQLDLGRQPGRHGALASATSRSSRRSSWSSTPRPSGAHLLRGLQALAGGAAGRAARTRAAAA